MEFLVDAQRCDVIAAALVEASGLEQFRHPVHYLEKHWQDDDCGKFARDCCVWSLPPGVITAASRCLLGYLPLVVFKRLTVGL